MKATRVKSKPNYTGFLREMEVGETKVIKLMGMAYSSLQVVRYRMRRTKEGEFNFQRNDNSTELTITRLS